MRSVLIATIIALLCCTAQAEVLRNKLGVARSGLLQTTNKLFLELPPMAPWEEAEEVDDEAAEEAVDGESDSAEEELVEESTKEATEEAAEAFLEQPPHAPWEDEAAEETIDDDTEEITEDVEE
jgi:hypothetical protein